MIEIISAILLFIYAVSASPSSCSITLPGAATSFKPGASISVAATYINTPQAAYSFGATLTPSSGVPSATTPLAVSGSEPTYYVNGSIVVPINYTFGVVTLTVTNGGAPGEDVTCSVDIIVDPSSAPIPVVYPLYPYYGCGNPCYVPRCRRRCRVSGEEIEGSEQPLELQGEEQQQQEEAVLAF